MGQFNVQYVLHEPWTDMIMHNMYYWFIRERWNLPPYFVH